MRSIASIPAVGLLAGSALGLFVPDIPQIFVRALLIACALAALWAWRAGRPALLAGAVGLVFLSGGALLAADAWRDAWRPSLRTTFDALAKEGRRRAAAEHRVRPEDDEAFAIVEGVLRADAAITETGVSLSLDVDEIDSRAVAGGVAVGVAGSLGAARAGAWRAGRRVRLPLQLRRLPRYLDPGVPDHERALARRGTILAGTVKSAALVEVTARGSALAEGMAAVRDFSRTSIAAAVGRWSPRSAAIVAAIVIGDRVGLDESVQRALQEAGTYHVIAISGGNIAILAGLMLGAFRVAGFLGRAAMAAAIGVLVAYGYLVGGGASVDRATLMAVVYFAGRAIDLRSPPLNTLALVAGCLVAAGPLSIADPAFVLTFGATLAILLVMPVITTYSAELAEHAEKPTTHLEKNEQVSAGSAVSALIVVVRPLFAMFAASAAAEAMLFPVGALVFSRVTFAGLALNFLAIPLMGVAQIAGMALVPLALVSRPLASAVGYIAHLGALGLVWSAELVRFVPWVTYRVAAPHWAAVFAYYIAAGIAWALWRRAPVVRRAACVVAAGAAIWILAEPWALLAARGDGRLHVTFLDVGQGDSAFVRFPHGATLLIDTGGLTMSSAFDVGDRVVAPVLRDAGVRRLTYVALTHGDPDHIGGAPSILREFRPTEIWEGIPVPRFEPLRALRDEAHELGIKWANVTTGDRIVVDDVEIAVRHPAAADWERQRVRNDDSIVIELRWRDVSFLLTGDIGKDVERTLTASIPPAPLRIIKVPHHGSLTSSTTAFLRAVAPKAAVFSVGRANHFGHPAPDVVERYRAVGAEIFRTDQDGAVMVDTDGHSIDIHTFTGRHTGLAAGPSNHEDTKATEGTKR